MTEPRTTRSEAPVLLAIRLPGIVPDTLGNYLVALGLARLISGRWPRVRTAWRKGAFTVVGGPSSVEELARFLDDVGANDEWSPYVRAWKPAQLVESKRKQGDPAPSPLAVWQAHEADERLVELSRAHLVYAGGKRRFNRLLGSGGNSGRREFAKGWSAACAAIKKSYAKPPRGKSPVLADDIRAFLVGESCDKLSDWGAASWFTVANKVANSGQLGFGGGQLTPWAMTLACEGLPFFGGGVSRRLGAAAHTTGAFPFVTRAAAATRAGEAGRSSAEVWAPIWDLPMALPELEAMFARGRAELSGKAANAPGAFATAVVKRGVDAGIARFQRFVLGQTTSANTFESRLEATIPLPTARAGAAIETGHIQAVGEVMERALRFSNGLPRDAKIGQRWRYRGLRGPIEGAIVRVAEVPHDPARVARLLDTMVRALDIVDRNRAHREHGVRLKLLTPAPALLDLLFAGDGGPALEARLAMSVASMGWDGPASRPAIHQRFGLIPADVGRCRWKVPKTPPAEWIWRSRPLVDNLAALVRRRLVNLNASEALPFGASVSVMMTDIDMWLNGEVDEDKLDRWLSRFMLFDWRLRRPPFPMARQDPHEALSGRAALYALFRCVVDPRNLDANRGQTRNRLVTTATGAINTPRSVIAARRIAALLAADDVSGAWEVTASRFAMARQRLVNLEEPMNADGANRILAALAFAPSATGLARIIQARWARPERNQTSRKETAP